MGPPAGRRRAASAPLPKATLLAHGLALVAASAAWVAMTGAAVAFGRQARDGNTPAWLLLAVGTGGAVACLLLVLLLGARILLLLGILDDYRPKRARRR